MKRWLRGSIENGLSYLAPMVWSFWREPRLLVLMYHRVLPDGHGDRKTEQAGMFVSPQTLTMHLRVLREKKFVFVHLDDWLHSAADNRPLPRRGCALTFDDGWRDNYEHAYPILLQEHVPATIYLVADLVGTRYSFWPNTLSRLLAAPDRRQLSKIPRPLRELIAEVAGGTPESGLTAGQIDEVLEVCKRRYSDRQLLDFIQECDAGATQEPARRDMMSWEECIEMRKSGLVRFGSHTRRHTRLSGALPAGAVEDEVAGSGRIIGERLGEPPRTFCYPNGDTSAQAIDAARAVYRGAVTTRRGWHDVRRDPHVIRRIGVHEDVADRSPAFIARITGWL